MNTLLFVITDELKTILSQSLPELSDDWWETHVLDALTDHQRQRVSQASIQSLNELDLAAVLRVLDSSWFELSRRWNWPREGRNYLKETQTIRNRWAHAASSTADANDSYRDGDTLQRLAEALNFTSATCEIIDAYKQSQLARMVPKSMPTSEPIPDPHTPSVILAPPSDTNSSIFSPPQIVRLKSDHDKKFPVLAVEANNQGETRYQVFDNGKCSFYYESQLEAVPEAKDKRHVLPLAESHARLTALLLNFPSSANLYSLHSGRVRFIPYQYRPVLKLLRAERPRLLIADDVGVGKTIEAGLILKELQARQDIQSVLILCPKPLVAEGKWRTEMKRFGEDFMQLDGKTFRHCLQESDLEGEWPQQYSRSIIPFSLFDEAMLHGKAARRGKVNKGLLDLDPQPYFDLVIVDEAHHIRNSNTWLHKGVKFFCDHSEAAVFMTATPIQMGNKDLFTLLNVLRPELIIDQASFEFLALPNPHIHTAANHLRSNTANCITLAQQELKLAQSCSFTTSPDFQRVLNALNETSNTPATRVQLIRDVEQLSTFDALINRTRRRDIGSFTTRKAETISVPFTDAQRDLHDQILETAARIYARQHGNKIVNLILSTLRRQAASCLPAFASFLDDWLNKKLEEMEMVECSDDDFSLNSEVSLGDLGDEMAQLSKAANNLDSADPKLDALFDIIVDKQALFNNKLLLFTSFRHTLSYLEKHLRGAGVRVGVIHGGVPDEERREIRQRFAMEKDDVHAIDILLSTEVGSEGLDFQFCDALVNYDLPWNPMRIEQRIGRIDRYGQQSETVVINNLITPDTVDADIYERCLLRIGVFQQALGASEEILGNISKELHAISESFTLTIAERQERLQQLADNELSQIQEQDRLEQDAAKLFGLTVPTSGEWDTPTSHWLKPDALLTAVKHYLCSYADNEHEFILGAKPLKTLRLDKTMREHLLQDFKAIKASPREGKAWAKWLKGSSPHLEITLDQDCASENPDAQLLHPSHPLIKQTAAYLRPKNAPIYMACTIQQPDAVPTGEYLFALYRWEKKGVRPDHELIAIANHPDIEAQCFKLLQKATTAPDLNLPEQAQFNALDARHHQRWSEARTQYQEDNQALVDYRMNSLTASTKARVRLLDEQLAKAESVKIRTMRQSERDSISFDYQQQKEVLEQAKNRADICAEVVAFGVMEVTQ